MYKCYILICELSKFMRSSARIGANALRNLLLWCLGFVCHTCSVAILRENLKNREVLSQSSCED